MEAVAVLVGTRERAASVVITQSMGVMALAALAVAAVVEITPAWGLVLVEAREY
jgi:hypothetical protein